jgi:hypothetical protein
VGDGRVGTNQCAVPVFVVEVVLALEALRAGEVEGIFRIPADTTELAALRKRCASGRLAAGPGWTPPPPRSVLLVYPPATAVLTVGLCGGGGGGGSDEGGEVCIADCSPELPVHAWASLLKLWMRELKQVRAEAPIPFDERMARN